MYNYQKIEFPNGNIQHRFYEKSVSTNKVYKDGELIKLTEFKNERQEEIVKLVEIDGKKVFDVLKIERSEESIKHCESQSRSRSIQKIVDYSRSNVWNWFVTLTFSPDVIDRLDYDACAKKVRVFFNNLRRNYPNLKYLGVPEEHKNGGWHYHILVYGVGDCLFTRAINQKNGELLSIKGHDVYNFGKWIYGFSTATKVLDTKRVSNYIIKYITKDLTKHVKNKSRYVCSRNLDTPKKDTAYFDGEMYQIMLHQVIDKSNYMKRVDNEFQSVIYIETDSNGNILE